MEGDDVAKEKVGADDFENDEVKGEEDSGFENDDVGKREVMMLMRTDPKKGAHTNCKRAQPKCATRL